MPECFDWHHLIDLCSLVGALLIDPEGVYDPRFSNDRLLLGLKGTMSEYELTLFRQRSHEARHQKAVRGELRFLIPVGFQWSVEGGLDKSADLRIQQALDMVFAKFRELGSARQSCCGCVNSRYRYPSAVAAAWIRSSFGRCQATGWF